jgi:hypothetical protein
VPCSPCSGRWLAIGRVHFARVEPPGLASTTQRAHRDSLELINNMITIDNRPGRGGGGWPAGKKQGLRALRSVPPPPFFFSQAVAVLQKPLCLFFFPPVGPRGVSAWTNFPRFSGAIAPVPAPRGRIRPQLIRVACRTCEIQDLRTQ